MTRARGGELAAYEFAVARALADPGDPMPGAAIARWAIQAWAVRGLTTIAPLTTVLLHRAGRLESEVTTQIALGARPPGLHAWGAAFTSRLARDGDPAVAAAARLDRSGLASSRGAQPTVDEVVEADRSASTTRAPASRPVT